MAIPFRVISARSTAVDSVEVTFNHDVNPSISAENFTIAQAYGLGPLPIVSLSIKYNAANIVVIKTYTQIPFMFYKITIIGVRSLYTNEIIDTNYTSNVAMFDGFSENNTVLDRMIDSLSPVISSRTKVQPNYVEVETNTSKFFRAIADDVLKIYKEVGNTAMDNYLSLTVDSEEVIRGKGNYDRLGQYGAFAITRVSKEPSSTAIKYSEVANIYFDGDTQLITQSVLGELRDDPSSMAELAPDLTDQLWTYGEGWSFSPGGNEFIKNSDGVGVLTPAAAMNIYADTTYKVVITLDECSGGTFTYRLGGSGNIETPVANTTITNYIRTVNSDRLSIIPGDTSRFTVSYVSVTNEDDIVLRYDSPELLNAGMFLRPVADDKLITIVNAEEALIGSTPYSIKVSRGPLLKVLFAYNATTHFAYPLLSYALKNNFYDADNAFIDTRLSDKEFRLNPAVGGFAPPSAGDKILVVYTYNNSTRSIIEGSVYVSAKKCIPSARRPGDEVPSRYNDGVAISEESLGTTAEDPYGPSYLDPMTLQGLYYKISNVNLLSTDATDGASVENTSLVIFKYDTSVDPPEIQRVSGIQIKEPNTDPGAKDDRLYNVNPFAVEIAWDPSKSGRLQFGQYMVNYVNTSAYSNEVTIEYGLPGSDTLKYIPQSILTKRNQNLYSSAYYASYIYNAEYQEGTDYSVILNDENVFTTDRMVIGAITPTSSSASKLSTGDLVDVAYQYEEVFVLGRDYNLFANVEACYEYVENRVSISSDGYTSIGTLHYPIEEVNAVFSEGTGINYRVLRTHDNVIDIQGEVNVDNVSEMLQFKTFVETVDVLAGNVISLSTPLVLNAAKTILGGDTYGYYWRTYPTSTLTGDGTRTISVTTLSEHGLSTGDIINVSDATNDSLEGYGFPIVVTGTYTFQYTMPVAFTLIGTASATIEARSKIKIDKMAIRAMYKSGTDMGITRLMANMSSMGADYTRMSGIKTSSVLDPFVITAATFPDVYNALKLQYPSIDPSEIILFDLSEGNCINTPQINPPMSDLSNISQLPHCFIGEVDSSVSFEPTVCVYDGGGYCMLTRGVQIETDNDDRPDGAKIDSDHLTVLGDGRQGKTSPNYFDTASVCDDPNNTDPNLYNINAPCKSFSCCGYTSIFHKEVPFVDGKTEFYRFKVDAAGRYVLDNYGFPVVVRREPYGAYSIDYVSGVAHTSVDPSSVAASLQKQVTATFTAAASDVKNKYITNVNVVNREQVDISYGANAQITVIDKIRVDHFDIGTIYFSDVCMNDNGMHCTNYPYKLSRVIDQFQGKFTPTGCIYDQSTTGYSVCAKMDGVIEASGSSPKEADPDYIYRISSTSKVHGICMESGCRFYTPSGKQKDFAGYDGRGLYYQNCRNSMCPNYQPIYLGSDQQMRANYSYVADSLVVDYVYGDNGIDWSPNLNALQPSGTRYIGIQNDGEHYYVTYKIGARESALYNNFAYALGTPMLDASSRRWAKEMYRKAIIGVISAYLSGPTFHGVDSLVETFTGTPPEILEASTFGWILGENYVYTKPESLHGEAFYTSSTATTSAIDPFGVGIWMRGDNVLKYDGQVNFKISSGSLDMFVAPEWYMKNNRVIVDVYTNSSKALRGINIMEDDVVASTTGMVFDEEADQAIVQEHGEIIYTVDAGNIVSWKNIAIDTSIFPASVDETDNIVIRGSVKTWNNPGDDGDPYCGIYSSSYGEDGYSGDPDKTFEIIFETIKPDMANLYDNTGKHAYTCPSTDKMAQCATSCTGDGCLVYHCDCSDHCHEAVFVEKSGIDIYKGGDKDGQTGAANDYIGRYFTFIDGLSATKTYIISGVTRQSIDQEAVHDMHTIYPNTSHQIGDEYIIPVSVPKNLPDGGGNIWHGHGNDIATWNGAQWVFSKPINGKIVWVEDQAYQFIWTGSAWVPATNYAVSPNRRGVIDRVGFILEGYIAQIPENELMFMIHHQPKTVIAIGDIPTSRRLSVSIEFILDKPAQELCDNYGDSYTADGTLTCDTSLGISNIEVFYVSPSCAYEQPVVSTLFDIWDETSGDMFTNRMSIFRDDNNVLHFRVYEDKQAAQQHYTKLQSGAYSSIFPKVGECKSYYDVSVDLTAASDFYREHHDKNDRFNDVACSTSLTPDIGDNEWSTRRRHYFGFTWSLNDGYAQCYEKNSNMHVFVDGHEYPKITDYDESGNNIGPGAVTHGILCPDGTLYEYSIINPMNGLSSLPQSEQFVQRRDFNNINLCDVPKGGINVYIDGWKEDTTYQWDGYGTDGVVLYPQNIDYTGNVMQLTESEQSLLPDMWPCKYATYPTVNAAHSADPSETTRMPDGVYISDIFDALTAVDWNRVEVMLSSSLLQRKLFGKGRANCDGEIIDSCLDARLGADNLEDCDALSGEIAHPIDVGYDVENVRTAFKLFYRISNNSAMVDEMNNRLPWIMVSYNLPFEGTIPPCTDKISCLANIISDNYEYLNGRYLQYRIEFFTDGNFSPVIYSVDFSCERTAIDNYILPSVVGKNVRIAPLSSAQ